MIALLATGLIEDNVLKTTTKDTLYGKKLLASNVDALIEIIGLAQHIKNQAQEFGNFPKPYLSLLNNIDCVGSIVIIFTLESMICNL